MNEKDSWERDSVVPTAEQPRWAVNALLWRARWNPHDQSGRPGDTPPVGDEEMAVVGVEGERQKERGPWERRAGEQIWCWGRRWVWRGAGGAELWPQSLAVIMTDTRGTSSCPCGVTISNISAQGEVHYACEPNLNWFLPFAYYVSTLQHSWLEDFCLLWKQTSIQVVRRGNDTVKYFPNNWHCRIRTPSGEYRGVQGIHRDSRRN